MTIAIPTTSLAAPLLEHIQEVADAGGHRVIRTTEMECTRLLFANSADLALVTPMGYGAGVVRADYRIIPHGALMLHDYTNAAAISFGKHGHGLTTCTSSAPDDFLPTMGMVLLSEKFDLELAVRKGIDGDCHVDYPHESRTSVMDVSEEYSDLLEAPLPVYIWACRSEADEVAVRDLVHALGSGGVTELHVVEHVPPDGDHFPREGRITYGWTEDTEEALATIMELLFYHQLLSEIPAVKLLGRD
jgi:hypothetical protein